MLVLATCLAIEPRVLEFQARRDADRGSTMRAESTCNSFLHYFDDKWSHSAEADAARRIAPEDETPPGVEPVPVVAAMPLDEYGEAVLSEIVPTSGEETLPPELEQRRRRIRHAIGLYYSRKLNNRDNNAWEVMHSVIGYGTSSQLLLNNTSGKPVNSIAWLCANGACKGDRMLFLDNGRISARQGVGVQGHYGQFLAILAQWRVPIDYPMYVNGQAFKLRDLLATEQLGCHVGMELTFKLIALAHYLDNDDPWTNDLGESWTISRLLQEEIKAPIRGAACGGTHRLMGLAYAVRRRERREQPIDGQFLRAKKYLDDYHRYTLALQNPDGSFSTEWFARRGAQDDLDRRLQTTGHTLEWLAYSLPAEELADVRVSRAVDYVTSILSRNTSHDWQIGHLGHAVHALAIYDMRRFRTGTSKSSAELASKPKTPATTPGQSSTTARQPPAEQASKPTDGGAKGETLKPVSKEPMLIAPAQSAGSSPAKADTPAPVKADEKKSGTKPTAESSEAGTSSDAIEPDSFVR
jgi:hypothetical protein